MQPPDNTTTPNEADYDDLVLPIIRQALAAFRRDLPQLLRERPGQWVAYHGEQRLGFGRTNPELYQKYMSQGYDSKHLLVRCIRPEPTVDILFGGYLYYDR